MLSNFYSQKAILKIGLILLWGCFAKHVHAQQMEGFVTVSGSTFQLDGKKYYPTGANLWYGMHLGAEQSGDRARLIRELDQLEQMGVNNLRVMAASEGPDSEPWRVSPSLQPKQGIYDEDLLEGLDFLLAEMQKRGMKAVVCLNNFWPWSGGMAQYLVWAKPKLKIPYPPPAEGGDWLSYINFTKKFYKTPNAVQAAQAHTHKILSRTNSITNIAYRNDPTIMAWQLANEPRAGGALRSAYRRWLNQTAEYIKSLDSNHLVSTGAEGVAGQFPYLPSTRQYEKDHQSKHIDYLTIHIWAENWFWYNPQKPQTLDKAKKTVARYIQKHTEVAARRNCPIVIEEFGIGRDEGSHSDTASTKIRDDYYKYVFEIVEKQIAAKKPLAGCNFWAWGGEGRPRRPYGAWKRGDELIGDPPHEHQGWYSVYNQDSSTIKLISAFAQKVRDYE